MQFNLEYFTYDPSVTYKEYQEAIFWAVEHKFDLVSLPVGVIPIFKDLVVGPKLGAIIDFPFGGSGLAIKLHAILEAGRKGVSTVDMVLDHNLLLNANLKEASKELKAMLQACKNNKLELRPIIEYRYFKEEADILDVCDMLYKAGVHTVITNTGYLRDDIADNILLCRAIKKQCKLDCVITAYSIDSDTLKTVKTAGIVGVRFLSMKLAKNVLSQ